MRGLLTKDRAADSDTQRACHFVLATTHGGNVDRLDRAAQALRIVAAVEIFGGDMGERHRVRRYQIAQPHLVRFKAGLTSNRVQYHFQSETNASPRHTAI